MIQNIRLPVFVSLIFVISACTDGMMDSGETEYLRPLYPYQTYYDSSTFKQRRDNLAASISDDALVLVTTNDQYTRNGDINYDFRAASAFFYLTGFEEPNAVAVIKKNDIDSNNSELIMFVEQLDPGQVQWYGSVYGPEGAMKYFSADTAYAFGNFGSFISSLLSQGSYQNVYANLEANPSVADSFYKSTGNMVNVRNLDEMVNPLRVIKSPIEITAIQKAVEVSVQAMSEAIKTIEPGMYEYEVAAKLDFFVQLNGCPRTAFPTIVASGPNINIIHYQDNMRKMQAGDLVMIDFGAEYSYYAADLTRTVPVSGKFSQRQATIYTIVLEAYQAVRQAAGPGVSYYYLYNLSRDIILDRLIAAGIITGDKATMISSGTFRQYIPAGLGHCVGLDVHDPFPQEENGDRLLKADMVLAIEPHIYLYANDLTVNPDYWNISARIEDVILITAYGNEILSAGLPVEIGKIEQLMK